MKYIPLERVVEAEAPEVPEKRLLSPEERLGNDIAPRAERSIYAGAKVARVDNDLGDTGEVNRDLYENAVMMRNRARQLAMDSVHVKKALCAATNEILGSQGLKISIRGPKPEVNKVIEELVAEWGERDATTDGHTSHLQFSKQKIQTQERDGEFFCRIIEGAENPYGFALYPFEADRIEYNFNVFPNNIAGDGRFIQNGIEYSRWGRPMAYHVLERHPGAMTAQWPDGRYRIRLPAEDVIHNYEALRAGQGRGFSSFHAIISTATHLKAYVKATIVNARVVASKFGVITKLQADPYEKDLGKVKATGEIVNKVEAGRVFNLRTGEDFKLFDPKQPTGQYVPFTKSMKEDLAVGTNTSYATISGDLAGTSFASGRLGALQNDVHWSQKRTNHKNDFIKRAVKRLIPSLWMTQDRLRGIVRVDELGEYINNIFVHDPPKIWIDDAAQSKVVERNLKTGITNLHIELNKLGIDYDDHMAEIESELNDKIRIAKLKNELNQLLGVPGTEGMNEEDSGIRLIENKQKSV